MQLTAPDIDEQAVFSKGQVDQQYALAQLEQMLNSEHFRRSKRSAVLLRYLVVNTLRGQDSLLKERMLGIEVFGRRADYDTAADPVVRMAAGEIRKRIAQYYHDHGHEKELRIDLEPGSYIVHFRTRSQGKPLIPVLLESPLEKPGDPAEEATPSDIDSPPLATPYIRKESSRRRTTWMLLAAAALLLGICSVAWVTHHRSRVHRAWGSLLEGTAPTLIVIGEPKLYLSLASPEDKKLMTTSEHLRTGDIVSYSEVEALVRLVSFVNSRKQAHVQTASATTFGTLREGPVVLLGGLNNPWMLRAQQSLPIRLATNGNGFNWIVSAQDPNDRKWFVDSHLPYSNLTKDYAIVARFYDPSTQKQTLIVAGLGENGTKAAGEFITEEDATSRPLWNALADAPNFEVLLETQVIQGASGPPKLLAEKIW